MMTAETHNQLAARILELGIVLAGDIPLQQKLAMCLAGWVIMIDDRHPTRRIKCYPPETPATIISEPYEQNS